jgi:hypothetical protein
VDEVSNDEVSNDEDGENDESGTDGAIVKVEMGVEVRSEVREVSDEDIVGSKVEEKLNDSLEDIERVEIFSEAS